MTNQDTKIARPPNIIYFQHNEYDDDSENVPGVTFLGGLVTDASLPDSVKFVEHSAFQALLDAAREMRESTGPLSDCGQENCYEHCGAYRKFDSVLKNLGIS